MLRVFSAAVAVGLVSTSISIAKPHPVEVIPLDEGTKNAQLAGVIKSRLAKQRDVHTKAHGCIDGVTVKIREKLPENIALGIFSKPEQFDAIIRLSNGSGDAAANDNDGGGQGFALKLLLKPELQAKIRRVALEKWFENKKYYLTQDFLTINRVPEFFVENVDDYFALFGAQGAQKQAEENNKIAGKNAAEIVEEVAKLKQAGKSEAEIGKLVEIMKSAKKSPEELEKFKQELFKNIFIAPPGQEPRTRQLAVLGKLRSFKTKDPLVETYHSMVPSRLGDQAVKYAIRPAEDVNPDEVVIPKEIDPKNPNLNRLMAAHRLRGKAPIKYKLSLVVYGENFPPLENPSTPWPVTMKDYIDVADIEIPANRAAGAEFANPELCETIAFTPWHSLVEHLPVGAVQRTRETVYAVISTQRNENAKRPEVQKE